MTLRTSIIATLLLATVVFATPATVLSRTERRGFTVPAHRYIPKVKRSEGAVQAVFDGGGWIIPVLIGNQQLIMNVDTGSSDIWTASTLMPASQQKTVTSGYIFDPSKTSNFKYMQGSTFDIEYADGSGASGPVGLASVNLGGAIVPKMPFGVCNNLKYGGNGQGTRDTDGPVGLGFGRENSIRPNPQCTFMECLEPYVPQPTFSCKFHNDSSGFVDFGFYNTSAYTGTVTTININNSSGQWIANSVKFGSNGKAFNVAAIQMDFDTGTPTLNIPAGAASAYFALVPGAGQDSTGAWYYPCSATLPSFSYIFGSVKSGPATVTIPGTNLKNYGNPGNGYNGHCYTWISVTSGGGNAGIPFYISEYMMFNQAVPNLAVAKQT